MLMTAALPLHMDAAHAHGPSLSSSTSPAPPWLPPPTTADNHQLLCDFAASPTPAAPTSGSHLRPAASRRVSKRRPRPSRKLPTTYITADPASFRRMVHQVTGAHDLPPPMPINIPPSATDLLCRPAPTRAGPSPTATGPGALMLLPTLDTSAFLLGAPARIDVGSAAVSTAAPAMIQVEAAAGGGAGGDCNYSSNSGGSSCGGFPTLDSWDDLF